MKFFWCGVVRMYQNIHLIISEYNPDKNLNYAKTNKL